MKKFTFLVLLLFCANFIGIYQSTAQVSDINPDPAFDKGKFIDATLNEPIKAKEHNGALAFKYANDVVLGNKLRKNFTVEIEKNGSYYLSAYVNAVYDVPDNPDVEMKDEKYPLQEISVYIDDELLGNLDISKSGWRSSRLRTDKEINLSSGKHVVSFESAMPNTPNVDVIKLSEMNEKAVFDNEEYEKFLDKLKANMEKNKNNNRKIEQEEIDAEAEKRSGLKSASNSSSDWEVAPYSLDMKGGNYMHKMNVPVVYTYYKKIYFSSGTNVKFETFTNIPYTSTAVDPVMYLFSEDNFNNAWSNDDGGPGFQSKIEVTIPSTGYYYLLVRAYSSSYASTSTGMQGVVDIYKNGVLYQDDAPVSGYMVSVGTSNTGTLNYFTAYSTGLPKLWLAPYGFTNPIQFYGSRYWYVSPMYYYWFDDARFRMVKNTSSYLNMYLLVSSEGAWYVYWGNCDVFGSCQQGYKSDFGSSFPNMYDNDVIRSAPTSNSYNCASWAGGRTDLGRYFWASNPETSDNESGDWYVAPYVAPYYYSYQEAYFKSWDNFFGNNPARFTGAPSYSRTASGGAAEIALWTGSHASVRILGNDDPHGYNWESKCGGNYRIFHVEESFDGGIYGDIETYYYRDSGNKSAQIDNSLTFQESMDYGLTIIPDVQLSNEEMEYVTSRLGLKSTSGNELDKKFTVLIEKMNSPEYINYSHPKFLLNSDEYKSLFKYCKENENKIFNNLILKSFSDDNLTSEIAAKIYVNLTSDRYPKLMNEVKEEWKNNCFTEDGAYIAPSEIANRKNYIKKTVRVQMGNSTIDTPDNKSLLLANSNEMFSVYPNPIIDHATISFSLTESNQISLMIFDINGKVKTHIIENEMYTKGTHTIPLEVKNLVSGVYICKLTSGKNVYSRKILIK